MTSLVHPRTACDVNSASITIASCRCPTLAEATEFINKKGKLESTHYFLLWFYWCTPSSLFTVRLQNNTSQHQFIKKKVNVPSKNLNTLTWACTRCIYIRLLCHPAEYTVYIQSCLFHNECPWKFCHNILQWKKKLTTYKFLLNKFLRKKFHDERKSFPHQL